MAIDGTAHGRRFWALNLSAWAAIALLFAVQNASQSGLGLPSVRAIATALTSFVPCMLFTPLIWWIAARYRFAPGDRLRSLGAHALGMTGYVTIAGGLMGAFTWMLPWGSRTVSIWQHAGLSIASFIAYDVLSYIMVATAALALAYSMAARQHSLAAARLEAQLAEARLHALSTQLQPHFLFNTLNAISALVREDPPRAEQLLARLSDLLRQSLREGAKQQTSLEDELSFLEKYVEVQEARFGDRLVVTFDVDADVLDARVPNLILQPLVENAIRHGIAPRAGPGAVHIAARRHGNSVTLSVADDGLGMPAAVKEGIGLRNTRERLRELYGEAHAFLVEPRPQGGTICSLQLPLQRLAVSA